ncbi:MAG: hypothetical protein WCY18_07690 [Methanofastidiosum sp.]
MTIRVRKAPRPEEARRGNSAHAYDNAAKGRSKAGVCMFFF